MVQWESEESAQVGVTSLSSGAGSSGQLEAQLQGVCEARGYEYAYSQGGQMEAQSEAPSP